MDEVEKIVEGRTKKKIPWKKIAIICVVVAFIGVVVWRYGFKSKEEANQTNNQPFSFLKTTKEVAKVASPLTGEMVTQADADRHPLGVIIENTPDARPQSGLEKASIVYEAETEGSITRFLAIFGPNAGGNDEVGPIRSARSFFVDWIQEYSGYFTHAGQALDAGQKIAAEGVMDMSGYDGGQRKEYKDVASEHTLYNTLSSLYTQAEKKGYSRTATFDSLQFKDDAPEASRGDQATVAINFKGTYAVVWSYDKVKNIYNRSLAGAPHITRHSNTQLSAKNIIVQEVSRSPLALPGAKPTFKFQTSGVGKAKIIMDGKMIDATWKKDGQGKRTKFLDSAGTEVKFDRGVFWYEIVPPGEVGATETKVVPTTAPAPASTN